MKRNFFVLAFVVVVAAAAWKLSSHTGANVDTEPAATYNRQITLSYKVNLANPTSRDFDNLTYTLYTPIGLTSTQKLTGTDIDTDLRHKYFGGGFVENEYKLYLDKVHAKESFQIALTFDLMLSTSANKSPHNDLSQYLATSSDVLSANGVDAEVVDSLKGENTEATIANILAWAQRSSETPVAEDNESPVDDLPRKPLSGSSRFLLAARYLGIPSRGVVGYFISDDENGGALKAEPKIWLEYFSDDTWSIVDPETDAKVSDMSQYIAFRTVGWEQITVTPEPVALLHGGPIMQAQFNVDAKAVAGE